MTPEPLPRYDPLRSYDWNYQHAPAPVERPAAPAVGPWSFCGLPVDSPLGVSAGPLLNGRWCLYYAGLGFSVLTYKTVRSRPRACYEPPNLQPVACDRLWGGETAVPAADRMQGTWAVSFGMPSQPPDVWRRDVQWTRDHLPADKVLCVSVVGTMQDGWTIDDLADDYARCARWAVQSGADAVETNFSCPNVATPDSQLYQQPEQAALVAARVRDAVGRTPFIAKIGRIVEAEQAERLLEALAPHVDALAMTNSIAAAVRLADGRLLWDGQRRGICGAATREASIDQTRTMAQLIRRRRLPVLLIGVGGAFTAEHVRQYLAAGAHAVHMATAPMVQPDVAIAIRRELAAAPGTR